jgi:hypothetical protein
VDWIGLAQDRNRWRALVNSILILRVPWYAGKLSSGLSSSAQLHIVSHSCLKAWHSFVEICVTPRYYEGVSHWHILKTDEIAGWCIERREM